MMKTIFARKTAMLLVVGLLCMVQAIAQNKLVKGTILDEKKLPVAGATITVKGTTLSRVSDNNGTFSISLPAGKDILVISFIGYENQEVNAGDQDLLVSLRVTTTSLDNVVVNALGFETRKDKLGYATNRISSEAVGNSGEAGLMQALAGKSSGVRVSRSSGDPGGSSQI
ncbi:MAG: carboxypeptidase-like regulatory domain-containing protein, partial [Chitinophagaceae bacterium]|nr:carboxypeptidase-like regulatory domain-containing protein [Chitinophagaceae bacterium]